MRDLELKKLAMLRALVAVFCCGNDSATSCAWCGRQREECSGAWHHWPDCVMVHSCMVPK